MDIPAARWLTQIVRTWGTVITMVNMDRLPRRRLIDSGGRKAPIGGVGFGGIYNPQSDFNPVTLEV